MFFLLYSPSLCFRATEEQPLDEEKDETEEGKRAITNQVLQSPQLVFFLLFSTLPYPLISFPLSFLCHIRICLSLLFYISERAFFLLDIELSVMKFFSVRGNNSVFLIFLIDVAKQDFQSQKEEEGMF